jgi:hypothetical protein
VARSVEVKSWMGWKLSVLGENSVGPSVVNA